MNNETLSIPGLREVEEALSTLPAAMQADVLKRVHRDILGRFVRPRLRGLPYRRKKVSIRGVRMDKTAAIIGISTENFWLRFLDKGTDYRYNTKGSFRGSILGNNRITDIIEGQADSVIKEVNENYSEIVAKHLNRKIKSVQKRIMKL